jgi:hypothetical protein
MLGRSRFAPERDPPRSRCASRDGQREDRTEERRPRPQATVRRAGTRPVRRASARGVQTLPGCSIRKIRRTRSRPGPAGSPGSPSLAFPAASSSPRSLSVFERALTLTLDTRRTRPRRTSARPETRAGFARPHASLACASARMCGCVRGRGARPGRGGAGGVRSAPGQRWSWTASPGPRPRSRPALTRLRLQRLQSIGSGDHAREMTDGAFCGIALELPRHLPFQRDGPLVNLRSRSSSISSLSCVSDLYMGPFLVLFAVDGLVASLPHRSRGAPKPHERPGLRRTS